MTESGPLTITRRQLLESVGTVGLATVAAGAGTLSAFSDNEFTTGVLTAGTLDLKVAGGDTQAKLLIDDAEPGTSGIETVEVRNAGTIPGELSIRLHLLTCGDDDVDAAEDRPCEWDPDTDNSESGNSAGGQPSNTLANHMQVRIGFDRDASRSVADADALIGWTDVADLQFPSWHPSSHRLYARGNAGDSSQLFVQWRINETGAVRGETLGFGITVHLEQI